MRAEIRGIKNDTPTELTDTSVTFTQIDNDSLNYEIKITGVKPIENKKQTLLLNNITIPNKQTVSFNWGNKKDGYPVSLNVSNSNSLYKIHDIQSYAIPELKKEEIVPNFWQKIGTVTNTRVFKGLLFGRGVYLGYKVGR